MTTRQCSRPALLAALLVDRRPPACCTGSDNLLCRLTAAVPMSGKSRGFAFLAYEDQRSTVLAVDNLSGGRVAGRIISVNHVDNYKVKRAEVPAEGNAHPPSEPHCLRSEQHQYPVTIL